MSHNLVVEGIATACNLLANAFVLNDMCRDPDAPMPKRALALQMFANLAWITYAGLGHDAYLALTAATSFAMQCTSLVLRARGFRMASLPVASAYSDAGSNASQRLQDCM